MDKLKLFLTKLYIKLPTLLYDIISIPVAWLMAYWIRFDMELMPGAVLFHSIVPLSVIMLTQIGCYYYFRTYRGAWYFSSLKEIVVIIKSVLVATLVSIPLMFFLEALHELPRSILPLYTMGLIVLLTSARFLLRWSREKSTCQLDKATVKRVLIIGAGSAGERLIRDMQRQSNAQYAAVGLIDDNKRKKGIEIHGVRVLGDTRDMPCIVKDKQIEMIFIAMPSVNAKELRRIYGICEALSITIRTLPSLKDIAKGHVSLNTLRDISIEDLLGRDEVQIDWSKVADFIGGKRVLVTGGGGSIGSELCRQIALRSPDSLCILDNSECNLYEIDYELQRQFNSINIVSELASVTDEVMVEQVMRTFKPDIVFHAAAYKHVPLLESQACIAVKNNVLGTITVAKAAVSADVDKFILISTDKAVKPTNVMGATKRIAEIFCQNYNRTVSTQFITVRFGNVLGSKGSVVPLFKKQLEKGLPLTVTHPDITRYFMTIPEACQLILQATVAGQGGEIFVLDMGEPIKISYLAEQMIRLAGKEPYSDVEIDYIGLRPGEKLYEELFHQLEPTLETEHPKLFKASYRQIEFDDFLVDIKDMRQLCDKTYQSEKTRLLIKKMVPEYLEPEAHHLENRALTEQ